MSSENVLKTPNLNFKTVTQHPGKYRFLKVSLNNLTGNQVVLDVTASNLIEFKLPAIVYNLSKSILSYSIEMPAVAAKYNVFYNDTLEIAQNLTFGTAGGLNLVDIQNVNNYVKVARKLDTSLQQYIDSDVTSGLSKSDLTATNYFPPGYTPAAGNIFDLTAAARVLGATVTEPQYARMSGVNSSLIVQRTVPLSAITGSLLAMPQDQFFGADSMYLRIQTAPSAKVGYTSDTAGNPTSNPVAVLTQPIVKNIYLYLAVENDQMIIDSIMQKYHSGQLKYTIPFTYTFRYASSSVGMNAVQLQLNSQYGKLLKRVLYTAFPSAETTNTAYDHSNWNGSKIASYQTFLDSKPLQDAVINCNQPTAANPTATMDDWRENQSIIRKSSGVIQNPASYQLNWFHCDQFAQPSCDPSVPDSQVYDGLDLSLPVSWSINPTTAVGSLTHYCFCQFLRNLDITATGPQFF